MGKSLCRAKEYRREAELYYKSININSIDNQPKEQVKLEMFLTNAKYGVEYQIALFLKEGESKTASLPKGSTERKSPQEGSIQFNKFFVMEYYFEKEQKIKFEVRSEGYPYSSVDTALGTIMASRGQKIVMQLSGGEQLEIRGKSLDTNNNLKAILNGSVSLLSKKTLCYLIKNMGTQSSPSNSSIYKSEAVSGERSITFNQIDIPMMFLSSDSNYDSNFISIEIHDVHRKTKIGEQMFPVSSLLGKDIRIDIGESNYFILKCSLAKEYTFLDYLRGGMQIALSIGIDFTSSNGNWQDPKSLHFIGSEEKNAYEKAIRSCGDIVAYYDYDQLFPVYGYGAKLHGNEKVNHCFPISGTNDENINTIDGVLKCYREIVPTITFYGPTYFAPIINHLNNEVKENIRNGDTKQYYILMILTDGQINDMDNTIDELVEASYLPISVIIIGIGYGNFGNMDILDADDNPLYDRRGRKAARDLVQFVPFYKFQNDGEKLASEVLEEVPRQVVEYCQQNHITPSDPIFDIS